MKSSIDYNASTSQLGMGDRFKLEQHAVVVKVAWVDHSVDGTLVYVRNSTGDVLKLPVRPCFVVERAPRCGCGRRYENCDQGCVWPTEMEALFAV